MKKTSKRTKIIVLSILSVLVLAVGVGIALSLQSYEDPVDQQPEVVPLGDYDYSKRPFFAGELPTIYKGDIYLKDTRLRLSRIPLNELSCDVRTVTEWEFPKDYPICTDSAHDHDGEEDPEGCLDNKVAEFLIDAYESNGGSPIVYHTVFGGFEGDANLADQDGKCEIIRYDTANMTAEAVVSIDDGITDVMTYDKWVFFMSCTADGVYSMNVVSKKGGNITTLKVGKHGWTLMWANDDHVYYRDTAGNIYRATLDLQNPEFVYYAESISAMDSEYIGSFIHGEYLYFEADYEIVPYPISVDGTQAIQFTKHSIRRVPLNNLNGASELVAENVLDYFVLGVGNNILYYQPCCVEERKPGAGHPYYFDWTGGQLLGVNLDSLEQVDMINDVGLDFGDKYGSVVCGNALIVSAFPLDDRYHKDRYGSWGSCRFLYDTTTGALYPICSYYSYEW